MDYSLLAHHFDCYPLVQVPQMRRYYFATADKPTISPSLRHGRKCCRSITARSLGTLVTCTRDMTSAC